MMRRPPVIFLALVVLAVFMNVEVKADVGGSWPHNASWTIYRQDGSSFHYDVTTHLTYLKDHNGNKITINKTTDSQPPFNSHETMTDDFGRFIQLDHYTAVRDEVSQIGNNGQTLAWKVYYTPAGLRVPIRISATITCF